jgi:hypothetical protein
MVWLVSILLGLVATALWELLEAGIRAWRERSGPLAGDWYQVTYNVEDKDMAREPWSIEWIQIRHRGHTLSGTFWRIFCCYYDRQWSFEGRFNDGEIIGHYWAVRGEGGRGILALSRLSNGMYKGEFRERNNIFEALSIRSEYSGNPLEWIRVGSGGEERILPWLHLMPPDDSDQRYLPRRIRKLLRQRLTVPYDIESGSRVLEAMGYATGLIDLTGPLAIERERRRARRERAERESKADPGAPELE